MSKVTTERKIEKCTCGSDAELHFGYAGTMYTVKCISNCGFSLGGNLNSEQAVIKWNKSRQWAEKNLK